MNPNYDAAIDAMRPSSSPGAIVRIDVRGSTLVETAVGDIALESGRPLTSRHPFRIGGLTKLITAATVLRLHEQGRLNLDGLVAQHLPSELVERIHVTDGISRGGDITIRQLLAHTSGLVDRLLDTPFLAEMVSDPGRVWLPQELVEYGIAHSTPVFRPGAGYSYSDDGYVLVGMIVEAATSQPLHEVYREQILDPVGMNGTYLEGHEAARGLELSRPYLGDFDAITIHPSADWGGGGLVSTVADVAQFGAAIVGRTLFEDGETYDEMLCDRGTGYGLGIYMSSTRGGLVILGHDGMWGSILLIVPELDLVMAATINQFVSDVVSEAFFSGLIDLVSGDHRVHRRCP